METKHHASWMASALAAAIVLTCILLTPTALADELPSDWIDDFESSEITKEEWMSEGAMPDVVATMKVVLPAAESGSRSARVYLAFLLGLIDTADKIDMTDSGFAGFGIF
jgi:hypothetical protein